MPRKPLRSLAFIAAVTGLAAVAQGAVPHLHLLKAEPADKAEVDSQPAVLRFWFSEKVDLALTKVTLTQKQDTVELAALTRAAADSAPIVARIAHPAALGPGTYKVDWRTMGKDGHVMKGSTAFTLKDPKIRKEKQ